MKYDHRACPHCGGHTEHRIIALDEGVFAWCQGCFRVTHCQPPTVADWPAPMAVLTPDCNNGAN